LENRLATAELYGNLAKIDADLSKEVLKNTVTLKKLTVGDYIPAEDKFLPAFKFVNHAKLLFSANEIPQYFMLKYGIRLVVKKSMES
jgi:putative DNA primase/helicase